MPNDPTAQPPVTYPLIGRDDPAPFVVLHEHGTAPALVICDHASRAFPKGMQRLGLPELPSWQHIAWDIGAGELARGLAHALDAPAVLAGYSRLVVDWTHLLVTGSILGSQSVLARWSEKHGVTSAERFRASRDDAVRGGEITLQPAGMRLLEDLEGFLEGRVHRGGEADRVEAVGRRAVLGLFAAFHADPGLLDDHVLLRFKEWAGVPYWRDLPREAREAEAARHYRRDGRFARLLADHLAAMTDGYALAEHARLMGMGAIPIPSAEQLRREEEA